MARELYEKQEWENFPSENTPLSAKRFNHIEQGIRTNSENMALKEIYDDYKINLGRKPDSTAGLFSIVLGTNNKAITVGGGTSDSDRKNIHTLDWQGNAEFAGDVKGFVDNAPVSFAILLAEIESRYNGLQQQIQNINNGLIQLSERIAELETNQNPTEGGETI